jgi:hypothetical protein
MDVVDPRSSTLASIRQVLEAAGIEFLSLREDSEGCTPRRDSRIFQAQDRAIDDFTLKGKPRNGSIDKF